MLISRRAFLSSTSLLALAAAGCAVSPGGGVPPNLITDVGLVLSGLKAVVGALGSLIPVALQTQILGIVTQISDAFDALQAAASAAVAAPTVQNIVTLVEQAIKLIPANLLPAPFGAALQAIQVLLPVILAYAGLGAAPAMEMRAAVARMTPDEARAVLRGLR